MTQQAKMEMLRVMTGGGDDDVTLAAYLDLAKAEILSRLYPYVTDVMEMELPGKFEMKQLNIAVFLLNKRGAEGQTIHSENGVTRHYSGAHVPPHMLEDVVPFIGVVGE